MDEELMAEVRSAMTQWPGRHPHATIAEIEQAVEEQIARIRVAILEQVICQACGTTTVRRSQAERQLTVPGDEAVHLQRGYAVCPSCGTGLFPPGWGARPAPEQLLSLYPSVHCPIRNDPALRAGAGAASLLDGRQRVQGDRTAARRAGRSSARGRGGRGAGPGAPGGRVEAPTMEVQQLSADGAMVPLLHGIWAEARTLTVGIVGQQPGPKGMEVHAHRPAAFIRYAWIPTLRVALR